MTWIEHWPLLFAHLVWFFCIEFSRKMQLLIDQQLALPPSWLVSVMLLTKGNGRFSNSLLVCSHNTPGFKGKGSLNTLCSDY